MQEISMWKNDFEARLNADAQAQFKRSKAVDHVIKFKGVQNWYN